MQKIKINLLIHNGTILPMNKMHAQKNIIKNGAIAVDNGKIVDIGPTEKIKQKYIGEKNIDANNSIILPGLINTHTHAAMTLFRGIADDLPLIEWIQKYILPIEKKHVTADLVYWGTKLACHEMIAGGTTTFVDMYYFENSVAQAAYDIGMRAIVGETILGTPTPDSQTYGQAIQNTQKLVEKWKNNPLITPAIAPHAPYTCSKEILIKTKNFSDKHNIPLIIHASETKYEVEQILSKYNMRPIQYLDSIGIVNEKLIAAHCIHLDDNEIKLIKQKNAGVAHAPVSNMKLSSGVARIYDMIKQNIFVGLGTDGTASNNSLDMFGEMKTATLLQKVTTGNPKALNAYQTLELATIGGAKAIHMDDKIGSLEIGKKADIIIIDINKIHQIPVYNIVSQLVYASKSSDVKTVIINGKIIMENRIIKSKIKLNKLEEQVEYFKTKIAK